MSAFPISLHCHIASTETNIHAKFEAYPSLTLTYRLLFHHLSDTKKIQVPLGG